ncbi:MAG: hypothetical protein M1829_002664 [Trizodia sp. TS-e1964]|nr:MAG: hypothetical protein M1829_002664 [Trizodia sp. TS-e1964]
MASPSYLEGLPGEILQKIFIYSTNPDLPLVSSSLLAQLTATPHLKKSLAISMLLTSDREVQNNLLGRRFLDLRLFDAATREITPKCTHNLSDDFSDCCPKEFTYSFLVGALPGHNSDDSPNKRYYALYPDVPHFMFAYNTGICPRLLCNFQPTAALPSYPEGRFWKIELLRRLFAGHAVDVWQAPLRSFLSGNCAAAAQQGFYEAIKAGNLDAVELLSAKLGVHWWPIVDPNYQLFRFAVIDMDCADKDIVRHLRNYRFEDEEDDSELKAWTERRQLEDCRLRGKGPGHKVEGLEVEWENLWTGDWIYEMCWGDRWCPRYKDYVTEQTRKLEEVK